MRSIITSWFDRAHSAHATPWFIHMEMVASEFNRATALHFSFLSHWSFHANLFAVGNAHLIPGLSRRSITHVSEDPMGEVVAKLYLVVCPQAFSDV